MSDDCELLFFDTFSHDSCEELNLDLVQFPQPVYIFEIRVIPLGARVQADFPGGHRLGATNPSSFQLEFFVNDLSKRSASTFERLGSMEYKQNVDIQFPVPTKIPTDGLVLRGWYSAVTLAVYGVITKVTKERSSPPPPPPPQASSRQPSQEVCSVKEYGSPGADTQIPEWERQSRIPDAPPEPPPPPIRAHVEPPRFDVAPPIIHQPPEPLVPYSTEIPPPVIGNFSEPPPPIVYQDCVQQVPQTPAPYGQYEQHYPKPWPPPPEEQYQQPPETYDQMYNRPPDNTMYQQPPPDSGRPMWDPNKDLHNTAEGHDIEGYNRGGILEHPSMHRDKDKDRNRPWDRDMHDYKDDDRHDSKRKDRGRRSREASWERSSADSDRYRDRDRMRDTGSRDRDRDRTRDRGFIERGPRKEVKRPTTPPSPRKIRPHTPQTPPEVEKIITGPRTPKDEPIDMYDDRIEGEGEVIEGDNTEEDDGYEEIVSEEEDMSDVEDRPIDMGDLDYDINDESWNFMSSFSPYNCELTTFQHFTDPVLFPFEVALLSNEKEKDKIKIGEKVAEANKIYESLKEVDEQDHTEKWVETVESINETTLKALTSLNSQEELKELIDMLIKWALEGLDFELSLNQPQTAFKVRHLKAGIKLATLLFQTSCNIIQKLLDKDVPKCMLQLIDQPYMVLPVKLLILRGLDVALNSKAGLDYVVNKPCTFDPPKVFDFNLNEDQVQKVNDKPETKTCYQKLLEIMVSKQLTRAVVSISALFNKIHLYEILLELSEYVDKLVQTTQIPETKMAPESESPDMLEIRAPSVDLEVESDTVTSSSDSVQIILASLQEIARSYCNAWIEMAQMKRFLPAQTQFEFPKASYSPYHGLLKIFKENKLLENIFVLLSSPTLSGHPAMLTALKDLFTELLSSQEGSLFLLLMPSVVNGIQRALLHAEDETREEATEENIAQNLGMKIVYHLQALLYIDCLMAYHTKEGPKKLLDDPDCVSALHHMYTMIFSPVGRTAVIDVLTTADNLNALLPFVQATGVVEMDRKRNKSVCAGYVTELLMLVVHYTESVPFLEKFSDALHNLSQQDSTPKLHDLVLWMMPTRSIQNNPQEDISSLMAVLKTHKDEASTLPPQLVMALRFLQHLTLPKEAKDESEELKYMYAIIQVFANDGMDSLKCILQGICDTFLKPSHQSLALVGLQGVLIISIVKPAIFMLKAVLAYLISSRGTEFKDLTAVPVLLKTYSLMILIPPSSFSYQTAQAVQSEIVEAFLTYTQPFLGTADSEEALSKSLWTEMVQEILTYVKLSPSTFVTGLTVLSELLPLPLPLQTREPLLEEEVTKMVNYRKLWSAHLHSLSGIIQEVIVSLAATSCHPLQQLLRRVCVQLADLSAPTALFIVKAVLDALIDTLALPIPEQKENSDPAVPITQNDSPPILKAPTASTARILNLVAYLVSHASFKIPLMHVMKGSVKGDEKYLSVLPLMLELFNTPSQKSYVIQAHECIVSILQSLCDPDIGFITFESGIGASVNEVLSSSLPCKEHISLICGALVQHIGCHQHSYSSVLPSLRSLVMLTEHDYGFYHVKHGLEQHPEAVFSLFTRFSLAFSKDSSDCLSTLSTALEFLRLMVNGYDDGAQTGRSILLSTSELADLLRGDPAKGDNKDIKKAVESFQPVVELAKLLTEFGNDEEAVESLLESISGLLSLLKSAPPKEEKSEKEVSEPVLPSPESQSAQFASRPVFVVGEVEEGRLSPAYWLSLLGPDDTDQEQEQVPVDLISIAEKNIPSDFDLKLTLENLCLSTDGEGDLKSKPKSISIVGGKRKYQPLVNPALVDNKRPFIAPMRGRGFTRGNSHTSRANDPFRSRPPNTSRPPSMHVDDFVALESHHGGSSQQQQNKRPLKECTRGRGRGGFERSLPFTSTRGTGGRFFSPPGPYGRRESNRDLIVCTGGNRGTSRLSNNAWSSRSQPGSGQKLSPGSGQRTNFGGHRNDYNSPFNTSDTRVSGQRNRDAYTDLGRPSNVISLSRFPRGLRAGGGMNQGNQGHWQDRNKAQNQRFITPGSPGRGGGRRDMNTRHNRTFTR